jgi:hypothetical protein
MAALCPGCPDDPSARMRPGATQVKPADRCSIRRPPGDRTEGKHLVRQNRAMEDISAGEAIFPLHVERRPELTGDNRLANVRCVLFEDIDDSFGKSLRLGIP